LGIPLPIPAQFIAAVDQGLEIQNDISIFFPERDRDGRKPLPQGTGIEFPLQLVGPADADDKNGKRMKCPDPGGGS
jgi:hypothetical protein